jgi:phage terminase small subunit
MKITPKQERFVEQYLIDLNATQAAIRAGYSRKTAKQQASRLLTNVDLAAAIAAGKERLAAKAELTAKRVLEELRRIAFCDARQFFTPDGKMKPSSEWSAEQGSQLAGFEAIAGNVSGQNGHMDTIHRIKFVDKVAALTLLAKFFGLLTEKVEHVGDVTFRWLEPTERA